MFWGSNLALACKVFCGIFLNQISLRLVWIVSTSSEIFFCKNCFLSFAKGSIKMNYGVIHGFQLKGLLWHKHLSKLPMCDRATATIIASNAKNVCCPYTRHCCFNQKWRLPLWTKWSCSWQRYNQYFLGCAAPVPCPMIKKFSTRYRRHPFSSKDKSPEVPSHGITSPYSYFEVIWIFAPIQQEAKHD